MRRTLAVTTLLLAAACSGTKDEAGAAADTAQAAAPAPAADTAPAPAAAAVTDPQIAAIVVAANDVDVEAGKLALEHATDARVKEFAQLMITDHTGVNQAATELVTRLNVTPEPNPISMQLTRDGELARASLGKETGAAFDRTYIGHEVEYHQAVLNTIDQMLIPSARNADLKKLLEQTRPAVDAHLQHARELQTALGGA